MADVGIRLFADGEKEFKTAISNINAQMKNLNSEMKLAVEEMKDMTSEEDKTAKKAEILGRTVQASKDKVRTLTDEYERQANKLNDLEKAVNDAVDAYGKNSTEATKAVNAYNRQATAVSKLSRELNDATREQKQFEAQLKDTTRTTKTADEHIQDLKDGLAGGVVSGVAIAGLKAMVSAVFDLVEATKEYRTIMGTLEVSSTKAGYTAEQTAEAYNQLYGVLGDNQTSATALANLQALGLSQSDLMQLIDGTIGAWATYGDSIPIDSLAEAINETIQVGKVTGTFADVLNWAGQSEDEFNAKLAEAETQAQKTQLVLQMLKDQGLTQAAEGWREVNANIVDANSAQAKLDDNLARIADEVAPAINEVKNGFANLIGVVADLIEEGSPLVPLFGAVAGAMAGMALGNFINLALTAGKAIMAMATSQGALNTAMNLNPIVAIVTLITTLITALVTAYATNEEFRNKVKEVWETVTTVISGAISALVEFFTVTIPNAVEMALEFLGQIPKKAPELGKDIIRGLWNGINDMTSWIISKIKGFCDKALGAIKDFFGIESPSKVMRDEVGEMLVRGMAKGIDKGKNTALKAMHDLQTELLTEAEKGLDVRSNMSIGVDRATNNNLMKATEAMINGMNMTASNGMSQTIVIPVNLDGRQIAEVVFNPLKDISKQRGVAFG